MQEALLYRRIFEQHFSPAACQLVFHRHAERRKARLLLNATPIDVDAGSQVVRRYTSTDPSLGNLLAPNDISDFLTLLGINETDVSPPSLKGLNLIVRAHLERIPFQNITMLIRPCVPPNPTEIRSDMKVSPCRTAAMLVGVVCTGWHWWALLSDEFSPECLPQQS